MAHMQLPQMESKPVKKVDAAAAFQHILTLPSSAAAQTAIKEKRSYKCGHCNTTFRRSEHRIRHERSREFTGLVVRPVVVVTDAGD